MESLIATPDNPRITVVVKRARPTAALWWWVIDEWLQVQFAFAQRSSLT
jgi:hypothetical protein